jgi:MFS family permease
MERISHRLARTSQFWLGSYALAAAFTTYFSMYAFRKPFTVATYEDIEGWTIAIDFKIAIVICQVLGYALSKLIGVKVVSEATPNRRALMILGFIATAWLALVLFAVLPANWKILAIFLNGLPLGMIWGLVFAYLEGRRISEIIGAGLCASFIVSSGLVKSVGSWLIVEQGVPELWMPALTGLLFMPVLALSVYLLSLTPPPDAADRAERKERVPMYAAQRSAFFWNNAFGLTALILAYVLLTALRDFRDNFSVEIWEAVGYADTPSIFALTEIPVAIIVLAFMASTIVIKSNRNAVLTHHWIILGGAGTVALATFAFQVGLLGPVVWMVAIGAGLYMGYVPFNCILVDRMAAALRTPGNAAFFMYLADASGYAGSVALMLYRDLAAPELEWLSFFIGFCYISALCVGVFTLASFFYFRRGHLHDAHLPAEEARLVPA